MWICPDCGKLAWTRALMTPRSRENHRPQGNTPPLNFACNSLPLNFARNSLTTLSNFEFISLEFCGFLTIAHLSDHRITCEIGDELRRPTAAHRQVLRRPRNYALTLPDYRQHDFRSPGLRAPSVDELIRTDIKFSEIFRSVGERCRHNTQIVTACARLCRWYAHSHFALQLLGF